MKIFVSVFGALLLAGCGVDYLNKQNIIENKLCIDAGMDPTMSLSGNVICAPKGSK